MSEPQTRAELAAAQAALVRALVADGPAPDGFDPERLAVQARVLLSKHSRQQERREAVHGSG